MTSKEFMEQKEKAKQLDETFKLAYPTEEELSKMSYKEKQAVYKAKNKICKVFHKGNTYRKG